MMMRRSLLLLALVAQAAAASVATTPNLRGPATTQASTKVLHQQTQQEGFLSIPQDDPDPIGRARRLSYRARYWDSMPYGSVDPMLGNWTMAAPWGVLGQAAMQEQSAILGGQLSVSVMTGQEVVVAPLAGACAATSAALQCLRHLQSYLPLYSALDPEYQPAAYKFYDSDYAFARERITSSPAFITRVKNVGEVPFTQANVTGYAAITNGTSLADLVAQGRVYMVDFYPLYREGVLEASPESFLEAPTAVFFLDGPLKKSSTSGAEDDKLFAAKPKPTTTSKKGLKLTPLAIKYNVQQKYVVSPQDPHADWFLAKAVFNSLDRDVNAIYHYILHTAIANVAIAAEKTLASEHPLFKPFEQAAADNFGMIFAGVSALWAPGGSFDTYLSLSGSSVLARLVPYMMKRFDWRRTNLWTDLKSRGVADLPGFLYRDDSAAIYDSLYAFAEKFLSTSYSKPGAVHGDVELQAFLAALTNPKDATLYLKGFPTSADMRTLQDVSALLAQVLWVTGVQHHALNSARVFDFDLVYPSHPGKILAPLPASKGKLTDDKVQQRYLSGAGFTAEEATSTDTDIYTPDMTELANPIAYFAGTQAFAFAFHPLLQKPNRLANMQLSDADVPVATQAAMTLRQELRNISAQILEREANNKDSPRYVLLDPETLPFNLYI